MNRDLFLSCVADPTRHALLRELLGGDRCVGDLVAATGHSQSNVSHHLRQLRACGVVRYERSGRENRYRLGHPAVADALHAIDRAAATLPDCEVCA